MPQNKAITIKSSAAEYLTYVVAVGDSAVGFKVNNERAVRFRVVWSIARPGMIW